ncbi:MAG: T9SS type A sorting domain-containing protein, partial [Candidatus Stygibacter frigidus]|nr:T9SS type A sorting domain-containing protein [Candidatus Stygibacter frigidus]
DVVGMMATFSAPADWTGTENITFTVDDQLGRLTASDDVDIIVTEVSEDNNELPVVTALTGNYPNPFNPETTIKMALKTNGLVRIDIYNVRGQMVRTLVNEYMDAGNHDIIWNGVDDHGQKLGSGVYFYNMKFGKYTSTKKMILMK